MNITLTGAAGNITRPLAKTLLAAGHQVTVIGRSAENLQPLAAKGARLAVGSIEDAAFLTEAFRGADAVYTMVPVPFQAPDWPAYHARVARNYAQAITAAGVPKVVNLSTYGAHLPPVGNGPVASLNRVEAVLNELRGPAVIHLRAGYFYSNLLGQLPALKGAGVLGGNYGSDGAELLLVHPTDIATVAGEALTNPAFPTAAPTYVVSDVRRVKEVATTIGQAIGRPELVWQTFSNEQLRQGLQQAGFPAAVADIYVELGQGIADGSYQEHYAALPQKPALGNVKLEDYAREFAAIYAL